MAALGNGRMVIWFECLPGDAVPEHDHWHAREHMYERLGIPGFLRGRRAISLSAPRRYFVNYEVESFDVLKSEAYHRCLNNPTPWTQRMMPHVQRITRSICRVTGSFGSGIGSVMATVRFSPVQGSEEGLRAWLNERALPPLPARRGLVGAHLLEAVNQSGPPTGEQRLRGGLDKEADWVLVLEGYDVQLLGALVQDDLGAQQLQEHGAAPVPLVELFGLNFALTAQDLGR